MFFTRYFFLFSNELNTPKCEGFLLRLLFTAHNRKSDCQGELPLWSWTRRLLVLEKATQKIVIG